LTVHTHLLNANEPPLDDEGIIPYRRRDVNENMFRTNSHGWVEGGEIGGRSWFGAIIWGVAIIRWKNGGEYAIIVK